MQKDIDQVLIDRQRIAERVRAVAAELVEDLAHDSPSEDELDLTIIPVLTGSLIFLADLIRQLPLRMRIHLVSISSYPGVSTSSKGTTIREGLTDLPESLRGHHVLVVDDILDSGKTLTLVRDLLEEYEPASLRTCVLLRKQRESAMAFPVDYVCFDIPDQFIVGYGLDFNDYYRNLPDIVTLRPEVIARAKESAADER